MSDKKPVKKPRPDEEPYEDPGALHQEFLAEEPLP